MRQASLTPENRLRFLQRFDFSTEVFIRLNVLVRESFELLYRSVVCIRGGGVALSQRLTAPRCYGAC